MDVCVFFIHACFYQAPKNNFNIRPQDIFSNIPPYTSVRLQNEYKKQYL